MAARFPRTTTDDNRDAVDGPYFRNQLIEVVLRDVSVSELKRT
jgi:hypothetical protein